MNGYRPAAFSCEAVERPESHAVRPGDNPNARLVALRDAEPLFGKRGPQGCGAVRGFPRLPDGNADVGEGHAVPLGPRPLPRRHRGGGWLGRGLAPDARGDVRAALPFELCGDGGRSPAGNDFVTEIRFEGAGDGLKPDIAAAVIQRLSMRADVTDHDVVMCVDVSATSGFLRVLPDDVRVVLGPHGCEDTAHCLVALLVRQVPGRRQGQMMERDGCAASIPQGLHVVEGHTLVGHRDGEADDAGLLPFLSR